MSRLIVLSLVLVAAVVTLAYPTGDSSASVPAEGETVDLRHRPHHGYGYGGYGGYSGYGYRPSYGYGSPYGYSNYGGYHNGYQGYGYPSYGYGNYGYGYQRPGVLGAIGTVLDNVLGFREAEKPGVAAAAPEASVSAEPASNPSGGDAVVFQ